MAAKKKKPSPSKLKKDLKSITKKTGLDKKPKERTKREREAGAKRAQKRLIDFLKQKKK